MRNSILPLLICLCPALAMAADMGTIGLLDTPTARMRPDGEFAATLTRQTTVDIYSLNYQATPWLETTFRYSAFEDGLFDRSYSAKLRLLQEGQIMPQLALGVVDVLGTGKWGSEYLVANKQLGNLDISLGMGWGRFADGVTLNNPLALVADRFDEREQDTGLGGTVQFDTFFAGEKVGLFGGARYSIPRYSLDLIAEYNPDPYTREIAQGPLEEVDPWNLGVEWQPLDNLTLGLSHQLGQEWVFSLETRLDSTAIPAQPETRPYIPASYYLQAGAQDEFPNHDLTSWYDRMRFDAAQAGLYLRKASLTPDGANLTLEIANRDYQMAADAARAAILLADFNAPNTVRNINLILEHQDFATGTLSYLRNNSREPFVPSTPSALTMLPARNIAQPTHVSPQHKPLTISAGLNNAISLFDPDNPLRYQIFLQIGASLQLPDDWDLIGIGALDIDNNFDEITRESNSVLPKVRSNVGLYLAEGASGLDSLYFNKQARLGSEWHYRLYGGVLERMYSGAGGEILFQPYRSRLAFGLSANWVKQRDYDRSLNHLDYSTTTAFASAYWASPIYNYDAAVHVGQYLAKDLGATVEVRRTFNNGWQIGAWATFTDVPFEDFGEGSFDKGIFLRIPLGSGRGSSYYQTIIRSIQRDGGQRLEEFSGALWWDMRGARYDALAPYQERMLP